MVPVFEREILDECILNDLAKFPDLTNQLGKVFIPSGIEACGLHYRHMKPVDGPEVFAAPIQGVPLLCDCEGESTLIMHEHHHPQTRVV